MFTILRKLGKRGLSYFNDKIINYSNNISKEKILEGFHLTLEKNRKPAISLLFNRTRSLSTRRLGKEIKCIRSC